VDDALKELAVSRENGKRPVSLAEARTKGVKERNREHNLRYSCCMD
jgi:hypothetical protein